MEGICSADGGRTGSAEFVIGPSVPASGNRRGFPVARDEGPLVELALIAAEYGRTTLIDSQGGAVIFGTDSDDDSGDNIELF